MTLLVFVLMIALVDSINPTTIAPALYFAAGNAASNSLLGFILGVFAVNVVAGLVLVLGPGQALVALLPRPGVETRHLLELGLGLGLIVLAGLLWLGRRRVARHVARNNGWADRSSMLIGIGIVVLELPTAFPYFAAIAAIVGSGKSVPIQIALIALFNLVFVAPLLAVLAVQLCAGNRGRNWLEQLRVGVEQRLAVLLPALVLLAAVVLTGVGAVGIGTQ